MYLLDLLISDQLFLKSINTLGFYKNNLAIGIKTTLIDIKAIKFIFLIFLGLIDFCCQFQNHENMFIFDFLKIKKKKKNI